MEITLLRGAAVLLLLAVAAGIAVRKLLLIFIFWGFLVLLSTIVQAFGEAFARGWTLPVIGAAPWFAFLQDVFIVLVLAGIGIALWLRLAVRPKRLAGQDPVGAYMILGLITGIMDPAAV